MRRRPRKVGVPPVLRQDAVASLLGLVRSTCAGLMGQLRAWCLHVCFPTPITSTLVRRFMDMDMDMDTDVDMDMDIDMDIHLHALLFVFPRFQTL